jgi:hypothetical protein
LTLGLTSTIVSASLRGVIHALSVWLYKIRKGSLPEIFKSIQHDTLRSTGRYEREKLKPLFTLYYNRSGGGVQS